MRAKCLLGLASLLVLGGCYVYPLPPDPPPKDIAEYNYLEAKDLPPAGQAPQASPPFAIMPAPVYVWPAPAPGWGPWAPPPPR
jgi:hypothetical protein